MAVRRTKKQKQNTQERATAAFTYTFDEKVSTKKVKTQSIVSSQVRSKKKYVPDDAVSTIIKDLKKTVVFATVVVLVLVIVYYFELVV